MVPGSATRWGWSGFAVRAGAMRGPAWHTAQRALRPDYTTLILHLAPNRDSPGMSLVRLVRRALPPGWQPAARFHYERWTGRSEREMSVVCDAVRPGDRVADIGANHGVYTYAFARRAALVEAFEPQQECVKVLEAFAASHASVRVHPVALGDSDAMAHLVAPGERGPETRVQPAESPRHATIRVTTLDQLDLGPFSLLKIDVEGGESAVLRGATRTLERDRPLIFAEIEQRHLDRPIGDVFRFVESLDYTIEFLDLNGQVQPVSSFDPDRDQDVGAIGTSGSAYINNFFLSPRSGGRRWFG